MKEVQLSGSLRASVGKKEAKAARLAGLVPCVLYGSGEQFHFNVKEVALNKIVFSPDVYTIVLEIEGKKAKGVIRELQQHPVTGKVMHVDFLELDDKKEVRLELPVHLTGTSRGVLNGGRLLQVFRRLTVSALPAAMPDAIYLDITEIRIGQSTRVKEINLPGLTFLDPANAVVVSVARARGSVMEDEEGATEVAEAAEETAE
jgi:large subunit ribosomal protein L25